MKWETEGGMPTRGLLYSQLAEKLIECQEIADMLGHLERDNDEFIAASWYVTGELFKKILTRVTDIAQGKLQ